MGFMEKIFGDLNEKEVKRIGKIVDKVEALDEQMQALSDEELNDSSTELSVWFENSKSISSANPCRGIW